MLTNNHKYRKMDELGRRERIYLYFMGDVSGISGIFVFYSYTSWIFRWGWILELVREHMGIL